MPQIILDGRVMTTREDAHRQIKEKLNLPYYYGNNLDALYDCVSTMKMQVLLENADAMLEALGAYGQKLMKTLQDGASVNPDFVFIKK